MNLAGNIILDERHKILYADNDLYPYANWLSYHSYMPSLSLVYLIIITGKRDWKPRN